MKRLSFILLAMTLVFGLAPGSTFAQWSPYQNIQPVGVNILKGLRIPVTTSRISPWADRDSIAQVIFNPSTLKFEGRFSTSSFKAFATEDSVSRSLEDVLRTGNTTGRNIKFNDTSIIRWDKFTDYASIQYYSTADVNGGTNLIFTVGDNSALLPSAPEGIIFRKDTLGLLGSPASYDTMSVLNDALFKINNRINTNPSLFVVNRLTGFTGLGVSAPAFTLDVRGNQFLSGGNITVASTGNNVSSGGNSAISITATGNSSTSGMVEIQGLFGGVSFLTPLVMQRLGGNVAIGNISATEKLNVAGNIISSAPTYSTGGFTYLVRNSTSGRFESTAAIAAPTLDAVLIAGNTSTQNIGSVQSITTTGTSNFNSNIVVGGTATIALSARVGSASVPAHTFQVDGSVGFGTRTITANTTLTTSDCNVFCNNTSAITVNLPSAAGIAGRVITIYKINAATANVNVFSVSGLINGGTTSTITSNYSSLEFKSDGSNWYVR